MKNQVKKGLGLVLALCILLASCSMLFAADKPMPFMPFGRKSLSTLPNALGLIGAYDRLARGVEEGASQISLSDTAFPITASELDLVYKAFCNDNPGVYWLSGAYEYAQNGNAVTMVFPSYGSDLLAPAKALDFAVASQALLTDTGAVSGKSDYEKAKAVHDLLASYLTYSEEAPFGKTAYGAIVLGEADSAGYAKAYQYLLGRVGILSYPVTGTVHGVSHTWNLVLLDGSYYYTDLALDDHTDSVYYSYFNMPKSVMEEDHTFYPSTLPLPAATSFDKTYFHVEGGMLLSSGDLDAVVTLMKKNGFARVFVMGSEPSKIVDWFTGAAPEIARRLGLRGSLSVGYAFVGREYRLVVTLRDGESGLPFETSATTASTASTSSSATAATTATTAATGTPFVNPPVIKTGIVGADLVLDTDFTLRFYANLSFGTVAKMVFTMNGISTEVQGVVTPSGEYCFIYPGIKPHQMGDVIDVLLYENGMESESMEYSVLQYCRHLGTGGFFTEGQTYLDWLKLQALLDDMLRYGAATQKYIGYNENDPVDAAVTSEVPSLLPTEDRSVFGEPFSDSTALLPAGLTLFEGDNRIYFLFSAKDPQKVTLSVLHGEALVTYGPGDFVETAEGNCAVIGESLRYTSLDDRYTLTLTANGKSQTATFTVSDVLYGELQAVGEEQREYLEKMFPFFASARAYELQH